MSLSRSQWLAIGGGGMIVASPLLLATGGGMLVGMWGPNIDPRALVARGVGFDLYTFVRVVGMLSLPYGIVIILASAWFATARHFVVPSLIGIVATVIAGIQMNDFGGHSLSKEWMLLGIGNALVMIAALIDRSAYRAFIRAHRTEE